MYLFTCVCVCELCMRSRGLYATRAEHRKHIYFALRGRAVVDVRYVLCVCMLNTWQYERWCLANIEPQSRGFGHELS